MALRRDAKRCPEIADIREEMPTSLSPATVHFLIAQGRTECMHGEYHRSHTGASADDVITQILVARLATEDHDPSDCEWMRLHNPLQWVSSICDCLSST